MAYGDYMALSPGEMTYGDPADEGALTAAKAEGFKRATYLSQMDQFYTELEEMKREFDLGLDWQKEYGRGQLELGKGELDLKGKALDWEKEYGTSMLGLKERELDILADRENDDELGYLQFKDLWENSMSKMFPKSQNQSLDMTRTTPQRSGVVTVGNPRGPAEALDWSSGMSSEEIRTKYYT